MQTIGYVLAVENLKAIALLNKRLLSRIIFDFMMILNMVVAAYFCRGFRKFRRFSGSSNVFVSEQQIYVVTSIWLLKIVELAPIPTN